MTADDNLLAFLRRHRRSVIHTIDPFKVRYLEGLEKVAFLGSVSPFVLIGSTDCPNFAFVCEYMADLRKRSRVPLLTHFLPQPGSGYPICSHADGFLATSVINSKSNYLACCEPGRQSLMETALRHPGARCVSVSAVTIGEDEKTAEFAQTFTVESEQGRLIELLCSHRQEHVDCYYIFSRKRSLDPELIRAVRQSLGHDAIVFASGCIVRREQAAALFDAGADYVAVGSVLEKADWRDAAERLFLTRSTVDAGYGQNILTRSEPV
jgi:heptaprenylglyceryl phosphate synthase